MGQPKAQTITQKNTVDLGPQGTKISDLAFPLLESWANQPTTLFPGTGIAGFNPLEVAGQQYASGVAAPIGAALAGEAAGAQSLLMDPNFMLNPNQYTAAAGDAVTQRVTRNLNESILPGIRSGATSSGGMYTGGPTREGIATGLAVGRTNDALSAALADLQLKSYMGGLSGMGDAIARNPSVLQQQLFPASVMSAVGGQQRALEQAQLDEQIRNYYAARDIDLSKAQTLYGTIPGLPGNVGSSTVTGAQPKADPLMQALGIGMTMLPMAFGMPPGMGMPGMGMGMGK